MFDHPMQQMLMTIIFYDRYIIDFGLITFLGQNNVLGKLEKKPSSLVGLELKSLLSTQSPMFLLPLICTQMKY